MSENLFMDEQEELKRIRESNSKKSINDLNRKNLSPDEMDEIFCDF